MLPGYLSIFEIFKFYFLVWTIEPNYGHFQMNKTFFQTNMIHMRYENKIVKLRQTSLFYRMFLHALIFNTFF
jgi:hypothetical protein